MGSQLTEQETLMIREILSNETNELNKLNLYINATKDNRLNTFISKCVDSKKNDIKSIQNFLANHQ